MRSAPDAPASGPAGGVMRTQIEEFDWGSTPAGPRGEWPAALRTVADLVLDSAQPMFVLMGEEHTMLYNDAYAPILGSKHPGALGRPYFVVWSELIDDLRPVVERTFAGEASQFEAIELVVERHGYPEEVHWTFATTPIRDDRGIVRGLFCTCAEVTQRVQSHRTIEERERRLHTLAATTPDLLARFDRELRHAYVNAAAVRASGVPAHEMIGRTNRELGMPSELVDAWEEHIERAFDTGREVPLSFSFEREGVTRHFHARLIPELGEDGETVEHVLGVTHDVTEQVETSRSLQRAHSQLKALIQNVPLGMFLLDQDFRIVQANPTAMSVFSGIPDLIGRDFEEVIHTVWPAEFAREVTRHFRHTLETGEPYIEHERIEVRQDRGVTEYYDWQTHRIPLADGSRGVVCYFRDVSEQVRARQAIAESKERYRTLFHSIDQGFCMLEVIFDDDERAVDYRFLEINPTFAEQTGLQNAEGRLALDLVPDLDRSWVETYGRVAKSGEAIRFENYEPAMGRWFDVFAFPTGRPDEHRVALLFKDVTASKQAERDLVRQKDQLQALYSLSDAVHRAAGLDEMCVLAIDRLVEATGADRASILLFDDQDRMRFRAWKGLSDTYRSAVEHHTPWAPGDTDAEPFAVADVLEDDELAPYREVFRAEGLRAMAFIPLIGEDRVLGKFMVYFNQPHTFTDDEIAVCKAAATSVALSIARGRAADALRTERDLVRTIAENSTSALAMIDADGYCTYTNRALLEMTGFSSEELASKPLHDLIHHHHPDGRPYPIDECPIDRALPENAQVRAHEDTFFRKDGSPFPALCAASPILRDGRPASTVVEIRDITAEKKAEAALRESERRFRMMADTAPSLLWVTNTENRCTFLSRGWYEYTGQEPGTGRGFGWLDMVHPDDRPNAEREFLNTAAEHAPFRLDFRLRRADGEYRWVFDEGRPRFDSEGEWQGYIGSVVDVHDRKVVADALIESERNLRALSNSLEQRVAERTAELRRQTARLRNLASQLASAEQRERKRLAAVLHDDLQQLLFAALIRLGSIPTADDETNGAVAEASRHLSEAIASARALTHQLRPPALYEAGLVPAFEWLATQMAQRYDLEVDLRGTDAEPPASDDVKALLFDCVRELLFNVVKYARIKVAQVELERTQTTFRVRVSDDGAGFDVNQLAREETTGGFGLFSVRERLAALSGSMEIDSAPGSGTRVTLVVPMGLPVTRGIDFLRPPPLRTPQANDPLAVDDDGPPKVRVVLADDHAIVRDGLATILSASDAIEVVGFASDGLEAVRAVETLRPDVVLMDLNMPRMNGLEATEAIRASWPDTIVIGLSIQGDEATAKSMLAAGAAAFVPKADDSDELVAKILTVMQSRQRGDGSTHETEGV